jgi:alkyl hydroperoxide reductase subunit AhpC
MAKLLLSAAHSDHTADLPTPSLGSWLGDNWALLFSHPGDFVSCELEMDRWLSVLQRTFATARIKALQLLSIPGQALEGGWISEVSGDTTLVSLSDVREAKSNACDLQVYALREAICALGRRRFAMIVDDSLRIRRTYTYSALAEVPSPLEFVGWAAAARAKGAATAWAAARRAAT